MSFRRRRRPLDDVLREYDMSPRLSFHSAVAIDHVILLLYLHTHTRAANLMRRMTRTCSLARKIHNLSNRSIVRYSTQTHRALAYVRGTYVYMRVAAFDERGLSLQSNTVSFFKNINLVFVCSRKKLGAASLEATGTHDAHAMRHARNSTAHRPSPPPSLPFLSAVYVAMPMKKL